jgi:uncharacterized protein involved in exopolysaccharide biosynthesis
MTWPSPGAEVAAGARSEQVALQRQVLTSRSLLDEVLSTLSSDAVPPADPTPRSVAELQDMLAVIPVGEAGALELQAEGPDPAVLPTVVNTWIDVYLAVQNASRETASDSADAELREQSATLEQKVIAKRTQLEDFRRQYNIDSIERDENRALSKLQGLNESLNTANELEVSTESRLTAMRRAVAEGKPVVRIEDERTLANLEQRAQEMREQMKDFEQRYTPAYMELKADVQTVKRNLQRVEEAIQEKRQQAQQAALAEAEREYQGAREQAARLRTQFDEYKQTVAEFTARFAEHEALQEELTELEQLFRDVQQRLVKTEVMDEHQRPRLESLERAFEPVRPVRPLYWRDAGISVAVAFVLGMLAILLYEFFTRKAEQPAASHEFPFLYRILQRTQPAPQFPVEHPAPVLEHALPRELAESEVEDLVAAGDEATRALIMALLSGFTVEEAAALHWQDVDLPAEEAHIGGKNPRDVPLPSPLCESLAGLGSDVKTITANVWVDSEGNPLTGDDLAALITTAAYDAGLTQPAQVTGEALCHTYIAYLVRQGAGLKDLKKFTAPIPPTELVIYGRLSPPGPGVPLDQIDRVYPSFRQSA